MKPPLLKGAYWGLVDIDWSALNFLWFSAVFPTPLVSMRHAGLRSFKVPCFTTGATGGREMQVRGCDGSLFFEGRNFEKWPKVMA